LKFLESTEYSRLPELSPNEDGNDLKVVTKITKRGKERQPTAIKNLFQKVKLKQIIMKSFKHKRSFKVTVSWHAEFQDLSNFSFVASIFIFVFLISVS
jgi:hypothetical protein